MCWHVWTFNNPPSFHRPYNTTTNKLQYSYHTLNEASCPWQAHKEYNILRQRKSKLLIIYKNWHKNFHSQTFSSRSLVSTLPLQVSKMDWEIWGGKMFRVTRLDWFCFACLKKKWANETFMSIVITHAQIINAAQQVNEGICS